jgi:hypothetical protein
VSVQSKLIAAMVLSSLAIVPAACLPAVARAAEPAPLSLAAAPPTLTYGASTMLTATTGVPGATLSLSRKRSGEAEFTVVDTVVADGSGVVSWTRTPPSSATFRVDFAGDETWGAASAEVSVGVRPRVTLAVTARTPVVEDGRIRYTLTVRPAHPGGAVQLRRWTAEGWTVLKDLTLGADSRATVVLPAGKPGELIVRAAMAADAEHLPGHSRSWKTTVYERRNPYGVPTKPAHLILVDLSRYKLYYHEHGVLLRVFKCVLGRPGLPTPKGHFKIYAKDPHMSGPYGPFRMRYLGLFAIHGTNEPWLLDRFPRNYSHGCTRLSNTNITWLYSRVHVGTPVWNVP